MNGNYKDWEFKCCVAKKLNVHQGLPVLLSRITYTTLLPIFIFPKVNLRPPGSHNIALVQEKMHPSKRVDSNTHQ